MKTYRERQTEARAKAQEWQRAAQENNFSYGELIIYQAHIETLGKQYGLIREFRENGII
jgi:hypothetical protein